MGRDTDQFTTDLYRDPVRFPRENRSGGIRRVSRFYTVTARPILKTLPEFSRKLRDGTILRQQPDGREIVAAMTRARVPASEVVRWSEQCFCPNPLAHERQTVYDHYCTDMLIEPVNGDIAYEGEPFMTLLARGTAQRASPRASVYQGAGGRSSWWRRRTWSDSRT